MFRNDSIEDLRRDLEVQRGRVTALADALSALLKLAPEETLDALRVHMAEQLDSVHGSGIHEGYRVELYEGLGIITKD
ncbi:hypothetical protein [Xanthomonas campestris]|uniref:hypothetical protein n=1 Tax=Xanthomonas campestris TaxID=339 RepID=UPI0005AF16D7|nr:hypothetical protein [Xanthomonas campestris]KIQ27500.1 hypothetical protein RT95_07350 [Xanthomonas campestris]